MTNIIGIIPAGGKSERFGGVMKELLPISDTDCSLTRCVRSMLNGGATEIIVATSEEKCLIQENVLKESDLLKDVLFDIGLDKGLWQVIAEMGMRSADRYFFAMPDTVFPEHIFEQVDADQLVTAFTFKTNQPQRFGVFLDDGEIIDKKALYARGLGYTAWGAWAFSQEAMDYLRVILRQKEDLTECLNELMKVYSPDKISMPFYYDFATFDDYREYLCKHT